MTRTQNDPVDVLLEPPASVSIYLQALLAADRHHEVDVVQQCHHQAAETARGALEHAGVWSSTTEVSVSTPYRYDVESPDIEVVEHVLAEAKGEPRLHAHLVIRLPNATHLGQAALERALPFVRRRYERSLTDGLAAELGLAVREPDGTRQLAGVPEDLLAPRAPTECRVQVGARQVR